jgi:DNA replication licensing factor MCM5
MFGTLVRVPGIVINASMLTAKATFLHLTCKSCRHNKIIPVGKGIGGAQLPRHCDSEPAADQPKTCPVDPFVIVHDRCIFMDQQTLKLQETPDMIPVGELPRPILMVADRNLTNKVMPGSRITVTGIYSTFTATKGVRNTH